MSTLVDYTIDFDVEIPEEIMYRSTHYRDLRLALNKLLDRGTEEWMRVSLHPRDGEKLNGVGDRFRAAVYTWSTATELSKTGKTVVTRTAKNDDGEPTAIYISIVRKE
jgi:hypothetical protein